MTGPTLAAFAAALLFGVAVFPWSSTAKSLGQPGVFLFVGVAYLLTGLVLYGVGGFPTPLTVRSAGLAVLMSVLYVSAVIGCNYAFGHPSVNLPIATAITAAYPVVSAIIAVVLMGQRFTFRETVFFTMAVTGVVGLGLSSK